MISLDGFGFQTQVLPLLVLNHHHVTPESTSLSFCRQYIGLIVISITSGEKDE